MISLLIALVIMASNYTQQNDRVGDEFLANGHKMESIFNACFSADFRNDTATDLRIACLNFLDKYNHQIKNLFNDTRNEMISILVG